MTLQVVVLSQAAADLEDGIDFYYRDHAGLRQVVAVLDMRRNPSWIREELESRDL